MPSNCPSHLLARLQTLHAHVLHLAERLEQEQAFEEELVMASENVRRALTARSRILVQTTILEHRELAQHLHQAAKARQRPSEDVLAARDSLLL